MKTRNALSVSSSKLGRRNPSRTSPVGLFVRAGAFLVFFGLLVTSFYSGSSASLSRKLKDTRSSVAPTAQASLQTAERISPSLRESFNPFLLPVPQSSLPSIATYAPDCTTPKSDFDLGDVVCAKATGVPVTIFSWHVSWVDPIGFIVQSNTAIADDQATYSFTIPATASSVVNDQTVNNVGTWRVNLTRFSGAILQTARFTVHQPSNPQADVFVQKFARSGNNSVPSGDNIPFIIVVGNNGPDTAVNVHLVDSGPSDFAVASFSQQSGPTCLPAGSGDCTIASLGNGDRAEFTAVYNSGGNAQGTYPTSATVSNETADPDTSNNTSSTQVVITAATGGGTCDLTCPSDITVTANTTEGGQSGAHVTYPAPTSSGSCGSISSVPASGSFFPVGTTVVNATSETGGGQCAFTVTVEEATNTNITCPANIEATADGNCGATVTLGTPTATGTNVTITVSRSDGLPMYDCDTNGENCVRKTTDLPFPAGVTVVTWTAFSHDTPGPYANAADEEAHRTGNATCQQTVTVNDVTPPTITAPNTSASADANCQAAVPDYSTIATVSDNCACASSDTSQICDSRQDIRVTQDLAPGTPVGLGPHTIHLTANDGSSNNGGAGNSTTISVTFTVNDTTAPVINCPASITRSNDPGQCSAVVNLGTATATDNCDSNPTVTGTRSDNQPLDATYPVGTTTITWTATDFTGNHSSCAQTIVVNDTELPTISCPSSITLEPTCPSGAIATYTTPVGMDNCPGAVTTRTAGLASGSVFPIGTTTVTYSVTDAHGNGPVSCSFTVTVKTPQQVIQDLINSVSASSLTGTQKNGLLAKLQAALDGLNTGHTTVACNKLSDFVSSVGTLISHGDITAAQGNAWISSANHVRNTIGCTSNPCT